MSVITKYSIREGFNRLKKAFEKIIRQKKKQPQPSLVLQPVRRNNLRGTDL
mgnify:CR=1 FL=1